MGIPRAQQKLTKLIKDVKSRDFKYKPRKNKPIDWVSYTTAQLNEMNDYLNLVREIIDEINLETRHVLLHRETGRPPKFCYDLAKAIMLQEYFEASNRVAAGLVKVFKEKLHIRDEITYKDIERAYENPKVAMILRMLFEKTNEPVKDKETKFAGDGTGEPTSIKQNYANDKDDEKKVKLYDMMTFVMGTEYKLLTAVEIENGPVKESPFIIPLLEETSKIYDRIDLFSYDAGAYSLENIRYVAKKMKAKPRIFPREDASLKAYGCMAKTKMLLDFVNYTQQWLREYHTRSVAESRNSADKRVFPRPLLKRIDCRRHFEGFARACRYNVRQLAYIFYLKDVDVKWLNNKGS